MSAATQEQRNAYKGTPERPWIRLQLVAPGGMGQELELVADTGNPFAVVIDSATMSRFLHRGGPMVNTNFGTMHGGWIRVLIPVVGIDTSLLGYASDAAVSAVKGNSTSFGGLVGLPLLRRMTYGGDVDSFWIRPTNNTP